MYLTEKVLKSRVMFVLLVLCFEFYKPAIKLFLGYRLVKPCGIVYDLVLILIPLELLCKVIEYVKDTLLIKRLRPA